MDFYETHLVPVIRKTCAALEATPQMQEILHGEMPMERFRWQIRQNYQYLMEYTKCWAVGLAKAQSFGEMEQWYAIVKSTFEGTVAFNRTFWAQQLGISNRISFDKKNMQQKFESMADASIQYMNSENLNFEIDALMEELED